MDSAYLLLAVGMLAFGGALVAEGARRANVARVRPGAIRPLHQDSGYTHSGARGRIDRWARGAINAVQGRHVGPGAPYTIIGALFVIGGTGILVAAVLGLSR